jgi:hypothetical protein
MRKWKELSRCAPAAAAEVTNKLLKSIYHVALDTIPPLQQLIGFSASLSSSFMLLPADGPRRDKPTLFASSSSSSFPAFYMRRERKFPLSSDEFNLPSSLSVSL